MSRLGYAKSTSTRLILGLSVLPGVLPSFHRQASAQTVTEHPYIASKDIKTETCLGCHPDKKEGKFVHSAVSQGCEVCHHVTSDDQTERTAITLLATGGDLCAICHSAIKAAHVHGPYGAGQCLVCHNPHSSDFPRQLRAAINTLCMSCHAAEGASATVDRGAKTVILLDGRRVPLALYEKAPKIADQHMERGARSSFGPAAASRGSGAAAPELACLFCHEPHAGPEAHLLRPAAGGGR